MEDSSKGAPQFATAEYAPKGVAMTCASCRRPIDVQYFQINGAPVCPQCADKIQRKLPQDSHAAFVRALIFGIGGAIAGFALYVAFALLTGLVAGLVSLAVGFIVGKAMHFGSRGVGGRRYQIIAALLTYLAVSLAAVPIAIHQMQLHRQAQTQAQAQSGDANAPAPEPKNIGTAIGVLALVGIASPFLDLQDPVHGLIGLVILFVGIRFAWRLTAGNTVSVTGPHTPAPAGTV